MGEADHRTAIVQTLQAGDYGEEYETKSVFFICQKARDTWQKVLWSEKTEMKQLFLPHVMFGGCTIPREHHCLQ